MRIIHRSIVRELVAVFGITAVCLNSVLMMEKILRISRILSGVGASFMDILMAVLLVQPQLLVLTLPMSFLLSVLLTYGRMNMDSETVVLRAAGMSMNQIAGPAMFLGAVSFLVTLAMSFYVAPASASVLRSVLNETIKTRAPMALEAGVFHSSMEGFTVLIGGKPGPQELRDIFIFDATGSGRQRIIVARSGSISSNREGEPVLDIRDGSIAVTHGKTFTRLDFGRYVFGFMQGVELLSEKKNEKTPWRLLSDAEKRSGKKRRGYLVEFHRRLTLPVINICLVFLGMALSMHSGKGGRLTGFVYGMVVFGLYYAVLVYFENLVRSGKLHHLFSWAPVVVLSVISAVLYRREAAR